MNFSLYCNFGFGFNQNYFSHEFYLIDLNSFLNVTNMSIWTFQLLICPLKKRWRDGKKNNYGWTKSGNGNPDINQNWI